MIAVIDYDTGNLRSVANALGRLGAEYCLTADPAVIRAADRVLLPGVGEASCAMGNLRERGLVEVIRSLTQPVLGICIGVQLLCRSSEEGDTACIGVFDNRVRHFRSLFADAPTADRTLSTPTASQRAVPTIPSERPDEALKIPHMGWNSIEQLRTPLFDGLNEGVYVYYVHSFAPEVNPDTIATTTYGVPFSAAIRKGNFFGTQFHPEKSASVGERILQNFLTL